LVTKGQTTSNIDSEEKFMEEYLKRSFNLRDRVVVTKKLILMSIRDFIDLKFPLTIIRGKKDVYLLGKKLVLYKEEEEIPFLIIAYS